MGTLLLRVPPDEPRGTLYTAALEQIPPAENEGPP